MKKILLSITALLAVGFINAQIYSANDSTAFAAWTVYDADGDGNNWMALDMTGAGSTLDAIGGCMMSESYINGVGPLTPDNLAISPAIDCGTTASVSLGWSAGSSESTASTYYAEYFSVYVVTNPALITSGTFPTPIWQGTLTAGEVMQAQNFDVSSIAGNQSTVYVVFRHHNCTDMFRLFLDDVTVNSTAGVEENAIVTSVYPNPTNGILNVKTTADASTISIITMDGKVVAQSAINGLTGSINVSELVNGVYFYEVTTVQGSVIRNTFVKN